MTDNGSDLAACLAIVSQQGACAVLVGGGVESAILCALLSTYCQRVHPLYVSFGLAWEDAERNHLSQFLAACQSEHLAPLTVLAMPSEDCYGEHWSLSGKGVPDAQSQDSAVELKGRNLLLIAKASVWCAANQINVINLGVLANNPFADATEPFFAALETAACLGLDHAISILRPFAALQKQDVIKLGQSYPLELTFSCINPCKQLNGTVLHCGACNKCAERQRGFERAFVTDKTAYAQALAHL